ncbi:MAG: coniferyl aldehyde dehydrogenase [Clostridia bacterium]|nr:coniferyl aldehyde dehydrogenase [Deltaproteobacteria bacterium]
MSSAPTKETVLHFVDEPRGDLAEIYERMRASMRREGVPSYGVRRERLDRLLDLVRSYRTRLVEAVSADFGHRSRHETQIAEIFPIISHLKTARSKLREWMKPEKVPVSWLFIPGNASVVREPLGIIGVVSPWNYPLHLALIPLTEAIAAGNRVMLKPSELTPATSEVIRELLAATFEADEVTTVLGGPEVAQAFSRLPFDHLFFTGSTSVGRHVMRAAADNLTPVTLELGGKSPALVHAEYDVVKAAERICFGKLFNAGQTCIAPDYALVQEDKVSAFVDAFKAAARRMYEDRYEGNLDYSSIVSIRHKERLERLLTEAENAGAQLVRLGNAAEETEDRMESSRKMAPVLVLDCAETTTLMREEIFGPILPVVRYRDIEGALRFINDRDKPLALYYFDDDGARAEEVRNRTSSGGMVVNDTLLHIAQDELPFGGVGASGMGRYHGFEGFRTFSNPRAVYRQSGFAQTFRLNPPYRTFVEKMLAKLIG